MGDEGSLYQYVAEELLETISALKVLSPCWTTMPEYEVEAWVEDFVQAVFWHARDHRLPMLELQQLYDADGETIALADFMQKLEEIWGRLPGEANTGFRPTSTELRQDEASVTAVITGRRVMRKRRSKRFSGSNPVVTMKRHCTDFPT